MPGFQKTTKFLFPVAIDTRNENPRGTSIVQCKCQHVVVPVSVVGNFLIASVYKTGQIQVVIDAGIGRVKFR